MLVAKKLKLNIKLKNVQYSAFNSKETFCFNASIYIDGKKVGEANSEGHGGPTDITPYALHQSVDEYGKTLPLEIDEYGEHTVTGESMLNDLIEEYLNIKEFKKIISKNLVFTHHNERGIFSMLLKLNGKAVPIDGDQKDKIIEHIRKDEEINQVLNYLPFEEAYEIYINEQLELEKVRSDE